MEIDQHGSFKGRHFTSEVILLALRWHLAFPISHCDLALISSDRGVSADHTTLYRWVQAYAARLEQRVRRHLRPCTGSWRVDETTMEVKDAWSYPHRAVGGLGQTIDFLVSAWRHAAAAKRFFRKALAQPHAVNPRTITVDKNPGYPRDRGHGARGPAMALFAATAAQIPEQHRRAGSPAAQTTGTPRARLRQLANRQADADWPRGDGDDQEGAGYTIGGRDMPAQTAFVADLFQAAA